MIETNGCNFIHPLKMTEWSKILRSRTRLERHDLSRFGRTPICKTSNKIINAAYLTIHLGVILVRVGKIYFLHQCHYIFSRRIKNKEHCFCEVKCQHYSEEFWKWRFNSENTIPKKLEMQHSLVILNLCLSKTRAGEYHDCSNRVVFEMLTFL